MCTDTKGRIAEAVEQMLQTRPVCKITVQRVMEQAQMKRQSFYYHYQDIYKRAGMDRGDGAVRPAAV